MGHLFKRQDPAFGMSTKNTQHIPDESCGRMVNLWEATLETTQTRLRSSFRSICARADADGPVAFLLRVRGPSSLHRTRPLFRLTIFHVKCRVSFEISSVKSSSQCTNCVFNCDFISFSLPIENLSFVKMFSINFH